MAAHFSVLSFSLIISEMEIVRFVAVIKICQSKPGFISQSWLFKEMRVVSFHETVLPVALLKKLIESITCWKLLPGENFLITNVSISLKGNEIKAKPMGGSIHVMFFEQEIRPTASVIKRASFS